MSPEMLDALSPRGAYGTAPHVSTVRYAPMPTPDTCPSVQRTEAARAAVVRTPHATVQVFAVNGADAALYAEAVRMCAEYEAERGGEARVKFTRDGEGQIVGLTFGYRPPVRLDTDAMEAAAAQDAAVIYGGA